MTRHPTVLVPGLGELDHAWDALGEWRIELDHAVHQDSLRGLLAFRSWTDAELAFDPGAHAAVGVPALVRLHREGDIRRTDAGGGALEWRLVAPDAGWRVDVTLWPGALHLAIQSGAGDAVRWRARGSRTAEYYARKYPA